MQDEIFSAAYGSGDIMNKCRKITVGPGKNSVKLNMFDETSRAGTSRMGGIVGYWTAEAGEKTASKPKFRQLELVLKKCIGLCYLTDELMEDVRALETYVTQGFSDELVFQVENAIVNGNGAGQPLGLMNSGAKITAAAVGGQGAGTIVHQNILDMWSRLHPMCRKNAVWLCSADAEPELHNMFVASGVGSNVAVYLPPGGVSGAPYATLMGRPLIVSEHCQTLGTEGDLILTDLNYYLLADKGGIKAEASIHVRFVYDETCMRFVFRCDGAPMLNSAITPAHGSNTLSSIVTLNSTRT
jgi:HK97 family phage major capsid protein